MTFDINDVAAVVQVATDRYRGSVKNYSTDEADKLINEALVAANNGKNYIDVRDIRDGKCGALFTIMEQIIKKTVVQGLQGDEYFQSLVETKVVNQGDKPEFVVEDANWFTVSKMADGTQSLRRQRLTGVSKQTVPTFWNGIKIYDEMNRVLAGQANLAEIIRDVSNSFRKSILDEVYSVWANVTTAQLGGAVYDVTGAYSEESLVTIIDHVEAKSGQKATIYGTRSAIRKLTTGVVADAAKDDLYNMGYYGKFNGTPIALTPQRHAVGTDSFILPNDKVHVLAANGKPIKLVVEGNPLIATGSVLGNADLSQEYLYGQKYGIGFILSNGAIGRYTIS